MEGECAAVVGGEERVGVVVDGGEGEGGVGEAGVVRRGHGLTIRLDLVRCLLTVSNMPITIAELEQAIRDAFPVTHLHIEDQSSGCGENYAVLLVSPVRVPLCPCPPASHGPTGVRGQVHPGQTQRK